MQGILSLLIGSLVLATSTVACSTSRLRWDRTDKALAAVMVACQAADTATTWVALDDGHTEANPTVPENKAALVGVKIGATLIIGGIAYAMPNRTARRATLVVGALAGCGPAAWNTKVIVDE